MHGEKPIWMPAACFETRLMTALFCSRLWVLGMEGGLSCCERDSHLPDARRRRRRNRFAARGHVLKNEADGVLCHRKSFFLILPMRDDLGQSRNSDGKPAFLFRLKDDSELACLVNHNLPLLYTLLVK